MGVDEPAETGSTIEVSECPSYREFIYHTESTSVLKTIGRVLTHPSFFSRLMVCFSPTLSDCLFISSMLRVKALLVPLTYTLVRFLLLPRARFTTNALLGPSVWDHQRGDPRHAVPCTRLWQYWLVSYRALPSSISPDSPG